MCGIAGIIGTTSYDLGDKMLARLIIEADGQNIWLSSDSEVPITLCHARLSILDLSH